MIMRKNNNPQQPPPQNQPPRQHSRDQRAANDASPQRERDEQDGGASTEAAEEVEVSEAAADIVSQLQKERDQAVDLRLRTAADFSNYQRRAAENERRAVQSGATRVVRGILPVLDHFDLALAHKPDQMTVDQLLHAVQMVRDELSKALAAQG